MKSWIYSCLMIMLLGATVEAQTRKSPLKEWGLETSAQIEKEYALSERGLYADEWKRGQSKPGGPAFMWGCGVQLSALAAAARIQPELYTLRMKRYISGLDAYWTPGVNHVSGYDVLPLPKPLDRYYDDNQWVDLAMVEAYEITHEIRYRDRAETIFAFVLSGEDEKLGGGIYWKEKEKTSKNACSNGPAVAAALRLYQVTQKQSYLDAAQRLYTWTNSHLQDKDGLYWDNIRLDGSIEKTKWSYNTALMLRSNCLLYNITKDKKYFEEAERIAHASEAQWVKADTGGIADDGAFAHLLCEAFLAVGEMDGDSHWNNLVVRALTYVHDKLRDSDGHYSDHWDKPASGKREKVGLLSQASAARAFLVSSLATQENK